MPRSGIASNRQLALPLGNHRDESTSGTGRDDAPGNRWFLGFTFTRRRDNRRKVSDKALKSFKTRIREITRRIRGRTLAGIIEELRAYILGWKAYFGFSEVLSPLERPGQMDMPEAAVIRLEAVGARGIPRTPEAGSGS